MRTGRTTGLLAAVAGAVIGMGAQAQAAGLLVADGGLGGALEIRQHDVKVTINNGVAVTEVTQVFQNMENRQVEALYSFPVPRGGSVANFSMWINGKEMVGEVLEKKRAREIYDSYKQVRRDPGLLEQTDYRTFEMRVFPIAPRAEQKVQVIYYQQLDVDSDQVTYVYPLATSTRSDIRSQTDGRFSLTMNVMSEVPIVEMGSPSHAGDFAIAKHEEHAYQASLEAGKGDLSRDVVMSYQVSRPRTGIDMIASKEGAEDGYFMLTLTAGEELSAMKTGMDYIFVQDVSGSMKDDGKLDVSRSSTAAFVSSLGADDRFEVIAFNVQPKLAFGALQAANDESKAKATKFMADQQANGGTQLQSAIDAAYRYAEAGRTLNVVVLSDGLTEQKDRPTLMNLIRKRPADTRVFCVGVGNDVNRNLLEQMAEDSGGLAAFVSREDNLQRAAEGFRRKLLRPVAADVQMSFGGLEVYDLEPRQLPNLYHGAPVRLYGRYRGSGKADVKLTAKIAGREIATSVPMDFPAKDLANPEIERMWAWHKVQRLLKEADASGSRSSVVDEIVGLGEGYSIATEYTSFLVLENDAEYRRWKIDQKNLSRVARDRKSQAARQATFDKIREKAMSQIGPEAVQLASAAPVQAQSNAQPLTSATPANGVPSTPSAAPRESRGRDINVGGGGAIDPTTAVMLLGLGAAAISQKRRARS